jgi:hypothetical protein
MATTAKENEKEYSITPRFEKEEERKSSSSTPDEGQRQEDAVDLDSSAIANAASIESLSKYPQSQMSSKYPQSHMSPPIEDQVGSRWRDPASPQEGSKTSDLPPSPLVTPPGGKSVDASHVEDPSEFYSPDPSHSQSDPNQPSHEHYQTGTIDSTGDNSTSESTPTVPKRGVPHVYHDYGQVPDVIGYVRKKTGGVTQPFPEKLHDMLHALDHNFEAREVVSWLPHGRAFLVHKPKEFTREIMPK